MNKLAYILALLVLVACGNSNQHNNNNNGKNILNNLIDTTLKPNHIEQATILPPKQSDHNKYSITKNGITLTETPTTNKGKLLLTTQQFNEGINTLKFNISDIDNYHLFVFLNEALYQTKTKQLEIELLEGNNLLICFLTDKNYNIIKSSDAILLKNIIIGDYPDYFDEKQPHLIYFSPNKFSDNLDFILVNTNLEIHNFKVKATIDNTDFELTKWATYKIKNLKKGEHTVRLKLLDETNQFIDGPFNDSGIKSFRIH